MLGQNLMLKGAKKVKAKYGWKGLAVAGVLAFFGRRYAKKKLGKRAA